MANVMINELNLVAIGDALRSRLGETKTFNGTMTTECVPKISKTPNALSATDFSGDGYSLNQELVDVVTIPNATRLKVVITYKTTHHTQSNYLCVMNGNHTNISDFNNATQYKSNSALKMVTLYFDNTDTVSFLFATGSLKSGYLGYYAEVVAVDADGEVAVIEQTFDNLELPNTFKPRDMAAAIDSIPTGGDFEIDWSETKDRGGLNRYGNWDAYFETFKPAMINGNGFQYAFSQSNITEAPDINMVNNYGTNGLSECFYYCPKLKKTPKIHGTCNYMPSAFSSCTSLEEVDLGSDWHTGEASDSINYHALFQACGKLTSVNGKLAARKDGSTSLIMRGREIFANCNSLRSIPDDFFSNCMIHESASQPYQVFYWCNSLRSIPTSYMANMIYNYNNSNTNNSPLYQTFQGCYSLDEINDLAIPKYNSYTSNIFNGTFIYCSRLKELTFAKENGAVPIRAWSNQSIDLREFIGYVNSSQTKNITGYNSGITEATRGVYQSSSGSPHSQYETVKDSPDFWTSEVGYSRYNHQSAVNTINSLPDLSSGSGNTIIFNRLSANYTSDKLSNLTEAEIAVAAAKGWTVSLV